MAKKESLSMRELIRKVGTPKELMLNVPARLRPKIRADLMEVIAAKRDGLVVPGHRAISTYIGKTYKYRVAASTVGEWLRRLEEELYGDKYQRRNR